jgi:CO/xanthine dehydrogenase FAD-binding subunit
VKPFAYECPTSLVEALELLAKSRGCARLMAGGTDLLVKLRLGAIETDRIIDVKRIRDTTGIAFDSRHGLTIGAAVSCAELCEHREVIRRYPALVDAASLIGGTAIQARASLGGNLCNAAPSADGAPALIVLGARCLIAGPRGRRWLPVEDFCVAPGRTALDRGEMLVALRLPPPAPRSGGAYLRFIPRGEMDIAVAGAAAWLVLERGRIERARVALAAVAPRPLPVPAACAALAGRSPGEEAFGEAARIAMEEASPISDVRGTAAQRRHLVGVLVRKALGLAAERAGAGKAGR